MTKKLFISYSHKDENFKNDLEEHLCILKRKEIVSVWHDRKITPSSDWKENIDENLEKADVIIFLVSSSFLASDYCYDIEVKRAMARHKEGTAKILSVIVRNCDWNECEFSKFQAVPKDAKAINLWDDQDTAWLDVVTGLKKCISELPLDMPALPIQESTNVNKISASSTQLAWLDDTEIALTHRKVDKITLSDIYVATDLEYDEIINNKVFDGISSDKIFETKGHYLLFGEEQQGKTTLLKHGFKELLKQNLLPIYLDSKSIKKSNLKELLEPEVTNQYANLLFSTYEEFKGKVLLIDNLDCIGLNKKYRDLFLRQVIDQYEWVIITCQSSFSYISSEIPSLNKFKLLNILSFGHVKREEIIKKWISLGVEESIEEQELYSNCDELKIQLNAVIKKNIVPAKPIYILMLMQMFEAYSKQNLELTSYGHCYQQLIYKSFENAKIRNKDYEKYLNVLTEISWSIFKLENGLNPSQLESFFNEYDSKFLSVNREEIITKLVSYSILNKIENRINFKYPYIYYFFVGKKLAEGFSHSDEIKDSVRMLLEKVHREDFANILIFITHHTKDNWVLDEIKEVLSSLFRNQEKASLTSNQLSFMDTFIKSIPEIVLEQKEIQKEREKHNKRLDDIEKNESGGDYTEESDILANINKTFKGMEIVGQIIRNRHATMTRESLFSLATDGISTGLRFLGYFIQLSDIAKNEIIKTIEYQLAEFPNLTNEEIQSYAQNTYLHLTYGIINGVVRKIASSVGSKEATEIYKKLEEVEKTPALTLINQSIQLQFNRVVEINSIRKTFNEVKKNAVCTRILKEMIVQHIYMFPVDYKTKQQLFDLFEIPVKTQVLMDSKKLGKG